MPHQTEDLSQTARFAQNRIAWRVVVVDDEPPLSKLIGDFLNEIAGIECLTFSDPGAAVEFIRTNPVDLLLTDLVIGDVSGVDVMESALRANPDTIVVLMTAYPTAKTAITVLQKGGYDYLVKPFKLERLKSVVLRGLEALKMRRENIRLREELGLLKVSSALLSDLEVEETLRMVLEAAMRDLNARGVAFAFDSGNPRIDAISSRICESEDPVSLRFLSDARREVFTDPARASDHIIHHEPGIHERQTYVSFALRSGDTFYGALNAYFHRECHDAELRMMELLSSSASASIGRALLNEQLSESYLQALRALAGAIEARDRYTAGHTDRVCQMSELTARALGWSDKRILELRQGCTLHDIGKIGVPDAILNKTGPLNEYEMNIMRKHPEMGVHIITGIDFLRPAIPYVLFHHERYDGKGYPMNLEGDEIPIEGRLLAVADTYDAIVSDRPYRRGRTPEVALQEILDNRGTQFDPEIVDAFVEVHEKNARLLNKLYGSIPSFKNIRALINDF